MIARWVFWLVQLFAFAELLITTYIQLAVTVWQIRNLYIWKLKALWVHGHWELFDTFIESHERISNSISFTKHIKCIKFCFAQPGYFDSFFTRGSVSLSHWFSIYFLWYWLFGAESAGRRKGFRFFPDRLRRMSHYLPHWELSRSSVILANRNPPNVVCLDTGLRWWSCGFERNSNYSRFTSPSSLTVSGSMFCFILCTKKKFKRSAWPRLIFSEDVLEGVCVCEAMWAKYGATLTGCQWVRWQRGNAASRSRLFWLALQEEKDAEFSHNLKKASTVTPVLFVSDDCCCHVLSELQMTIWASRLGKNCFQIILDCTPGSQS